MLKKIVSGIVLVMLTVSLMGCAKTVGTARFQKQPLLEDNSLGSFVIEKRDDEGQDNEERITLSLEDLKKTPKQEETAEEETPEEEKPEEQEPEEESESKEGNSYEYYRGQVAGDQDLGDPIEFDVELTPVFEDSNGAE